MNPQPAEAAAAPWWKRARFWFFLWLAVTLALAVYLGWDARAWLRGDPAATFRATKLSTWPIEILWWLLAPAILLVQKYLTRIDRRWPWTLSLHALAALVITGLFVVGEASRVVLNNHLPLAYLPVVERDLYGIYGWNYLPALIYVALILGLYALSFYREWQAGQRLTSELQVANARLETRVVRASLDALKMQLHPHFLFNTLNSITSLIRTGRTREAEDIVAGLGELLRRSLEHRQEARQTLEHELEFLHCYFEIETIRFQDRLKVEFEIAPNCLGAYVPSLMLQPLAENAMKHGISKDPAARLLRISAERDGTRLMLTVYNDGPPLPRDEAVLNRGIGVQNTRTRLQMLYGDAALLRLRDQPPSGVRAEIILPFQTKLP
jgi:signal transduction histidine kinase